MKTYNIAVLNSQHPGRLGPKVVTRVRKKAKDRGRPQAVEKAKMPKPKGKGKNGKGGKGKKGKGKRTGAANNWDEWSEDPYSEE